MEDFLSENEIIEVTKKQPMFRGILKFLNRKNRKDKKKFIKVSEREFSMFQDYLSEIDSSEENYAQISRAATLCDEAVKIVKQKIILMTKDKENSEKLMEVEYFGDLSDEDFQHFKKLVERYGSLIKSKNTLRYQISSFDNSLEIVMKNEKEATDALPTILDSEKSRRILHMDLSAIRGEKESLVEEKEMLENGKKFSKIFVISTISIMVFFSILLGYLNIFNGEDIMLPTSILVFACVFLITFITLFNSKLKRDLKINSKMQARAIELLNKKNVVYAYYSNFLKYEYAKYKVTGGKGLQKNLKDLNHYKRLINRIDATRRAISDSEYDIDQFLKKHKIPNNKVNIVEFVETTNIDNKKKNFDNLKKQQNIVEESLQQLEEKHSLIWEELIKLKEEDETDNNIISEIVRLYFAQVDKMTDNFR